jgi:hypothetical protein
VNPSDTHIADPIHVIAKDLQRHRRLFCDREIRRASAENGHVPPLFGSGSRSTVMQRPLYGIATLELSSYEAKLRLACSADEEHGLVSENGPANLKDLLRGFTLPKDHFREATPPSPVSIHPGKPRSTKGSDI